MKVLHLYANHKWTGPADLAIVLARAQVGQPLPRAGRDPRRPDSIEPSLALAGHVHAGMPHAIGARAGELELPTRKGLALHKHFHLPSLFKDARRLAAWIDDGSVDLLHAHQSADHLTAALSLGLSRRRVPLVRSFWEDRVPLPTPRQAFAFARSSAVVVSYPSQAPLFQSRFGLGSDRIRCLDPVLDTRPAEATDRSSTRSSLRHELGLDEDAFLVGITARIQRKRRWNLHWELLAELAPSFEELHFAVLGRPDEGVFEELCGAPLRRLGLQDRAHFLGYRQGERYWSALASLNAFLFLVPGTDASCRALREAMLLGLPVLSSDLGRLPEIVSDGEDGLVRPARTTSLAAGLAELLRDGELRARLGARARGKARERWSGGLQLDGIRELYARLLERSS
ncbi:MAG: glycosyltransferase family 4 protein [Planctomycetota bacterium]